jgi:hypothetical protein
MLGVIFVKSRKKIAIRAYIFNKLATFGTSTPLQPNSKP